MTPDKRCQDCGLALSAVNDTGLCGYCVGERRKKASET